jgi:transposase
MRYELTDKEWTAISPMLPNKPRGVPRVHNRRVLNGIFWVLRSGAPWRDLPTNFGPYTTCYNRFVRWRRAGVWAKIMSALAGAHDVAVQMIDTSIVRVHQHGSCITRNRRQSMGRSRGGLTSKIHALVDANGLPVRLAVTPGLVRNNRLVGKLLWGDRENIRRGWVARHGHDHIRRNMMLRLFAGISVTTGPENPEVCAVAATASRSRTPSSGCDREGSSQLRRDRGTDGCVASLCLILAQKM